jgi:anti-sigma regulatory factor (Ser/Thr protein kinase)
MKRESWLPARRESAPAARAIVREAAVEQGLGDDAVWDLMLATTEAVANAVLHGKACDGGGILLRIEPCEQGLYVEVCDCGEFESAALDPAPTDATHGRGIPIISAVVDELEVVPDQRQTRVRFGKTRHAAAA